MYVGQIVKIKAHKNNFGDVIEDKLGVILLIGTAYDKTPAYKIMLETGKINTYKESEFTATRGVSESVRNRFEKISDLFKEQQKIEKQIAELNEKRSTIIDKRNDVVTKLVAEREKEQGLLSKEAVLQLCATKFSKLINAGYKIDIWNNTVSFEYDSDIEKYFRRGSFVYEEYDGTMHISADAEKDESYKRYIKQYSRKINGIKLPFNEYLSLGDKDWLSYRATYRLEFKDFKKETVKKTIEKYL